MKKQNSLDTPQLNYYKLKDYSHNQIEEAQAFDSQIVKRINGGHIPDLDNLENCDYFYNNSWRKKYLAELDFGEQCDLILNALREKYKTKVTILKFWKSAVVPVQCLWLLLEQDTVLLG